MAYIYDLTDTWSAGGTAFNAIKMNVTDSASAAGSKLITLQTNGAEHFSVSKAGVGYFSGNVGIGTSAPSYLLTTNYNANATFTNAGSDFAQMWQNSSTNALGIALADDLTARFVTNNGYSIAFNSASSEFMRITSAGNVGIGTSSPVGKLEVVNNGTALRLNTTFAGGNSVDLNPFVLGVSNDGYSVTVGGTIRQVITGGGNVGIGTSSPSEKFQIQVNTGTSGYENGFLLTNGVDANLFNYVTGTAATDKRALITVGAANQSLTFGTLYTERMRIDASGNVGIGTASPQKKFVVSDAGAYGMELSPNDAGGAYNRFINYDRAAGLYRSVQYEGENHRFATGTTGNTERMRIDSVGNVGIGTSSPSSFGKFAVTGTLGTVSVNDQGIALVMSRAGDNYIVAPNGNWNYSAGTHTWTNSAQTTEYMRVTSSGNVGIGTSSPLSRFVISNGSNENLEFTTGSTVLNGSVIEHINRGGVPTTRPDLNYYIGTTGAHKFYTSGAERARINSSGDVCVAATSGLYSLPGRGNITIGGTASAILALGTSASTSTYLYHDLVSSNAELWNTANGFLRFATNNSEQMRIDSAGRVGIGTASPSAKLHVINPTIAEQLRLQDVTTNATTKYGVIGSGHYTNAEAPFLMAMGVSDSTSNNLALGGGATSLTAATAITFFTAANNTTLTGTERMRLDSNGNLLVGTTTAVSGGKISIDSGAGPSIGSKINTTSAAGHIIFENPNGAVGQIFTSGSATTYSTSSDVRLKENIADADDAASLIDAIQVRKFDWKADGEHQRYGFVAQELIEVAPEAVSAPADEDAMMGVDYSKLVPMLVKEIQSLRARVAQLEGN